MKHKSKKVHVMSEGQEEEDEPSRKKQRTVDYASVVSDLVTNLKELIKQLDQELDNTATNNFSNCREFLEIKVRQLGRGIGLYARCFQELAVINRAEMDKLLKDNFSQSDVREVVDDLLECEESWNSLLMRMEVVVNRRDEQLPVTNKIPLDTILYEGDKQTNVGLVYNEKYLLLILLRHLA